MFVFCFGPFFMSGDRAEGLFRAPPGFTSTLISTYGRTAQAEKHSATTLGRGRFPGRRIWPLTHRPHPQRRHSEGVARSPNLSGTISQGISSASKMAGVHLCSRAVASTFYLASLNPRTLIAYPCTIKTIRQPSRDTGQRRGRRRCLNGKVAC